MKDSDSIACLDRAAWRAWLASHHDRRKGVWLVIYKKATGRPTVSYEEAVEEAVCFGWIDSIIRRVDAERYAQRFSPRTNKTSWSAKNVERARKMVREGLMTEAGLAKFRGATPSVAPASRPGLKLPAAYLAVLKARPRAFENFHRLAPSHRRQYIGWILSAKKEETRLRRLAESMDRLEKGQPLGMK